MLTRLRRIRGAKRVDVQRAKGGMWLGEMWEVPVACIVVRNPRQLGEAQKQAMADRGRQALAVARRAKVTPKSTVSSRVLEPQGAGLFRHPPRPPDRWWSPLLAGSLSPKATLERKHQSFALSAGGIGR